MIMNYRAEYTYCRMFGTARHAWRLVGSAGGLHLWIADQGEEHGAKYGHRYSSGVEIHYRSPPEYRSKEPPDHDQCFLLKAPCWHDGSSLQAKETWIPLWQEIRNDHDRMFEMLATTADEHFFPDPVDFANCAEAL